MQSKSNTDYKISDFFKIVSTLTNQSLKNTTISISSSIKTLEENKWDVNLSNIRYKTFMHLHPILIDETEYNVLDSCYQSYLEKLPELDLTDLEKVKKLILREELLEKTEKQSREYSKSIDTSSEDLRNAFEIWIS